MAKEIVVVCDLCQSPATHVGVKVAIDDATPLYLDLCSKHHRHMVAPLVEALANHGYSNKKPKPKRDHRVDRDTGPFLCKVPGCKATPLRHAGSMHQHVRLWHAMKLDEYCEVYGELVPMTPEEVEAHVVTVACEEKGCNTVYSTVTGTRWPQQALISHMRGRHGIKASPRNRRGEL